MKVIIENGITKNLRSITKVAADIPLKMECINKHNIRLVKKDCCCNDYENIIILPYTDPELIEALDSVIYNMAMNTEWQNNDPNKTQMNIMVYEDLTGLEAMLSIRVFPPDYSEKERIEILTTADQEHPLADSDDEFERNYSDYNNWLSIFKAIDDRETRIKNTHSYVYIPSEKDVFALKLKQKERLKIFEFLYLHMLMVHNGEWYLSEKETAKKKEEKIALFEKQWSEIQKHPMSSKELDKLVKAQAKRGELYPRHFPTNDF